MALIIPPGFLQAVYEFTLSGDTENMVVTLGHEIDSASGANGLDAADDLWGAFNTHIFQTRGQGAYTFVGVTVYVGNDGPPSVYTSTEAPVAGPGTSQLLPPNSAYLIRKRTDLAGRRGRGRMYFPGVTEGNVDNVGTLTGAEQSAWTTALEDWYEFLTAGVGARLYPPVVLHRSEGIGEEPAPTPVTSFTIDAKIATQRRRLRP